MALNQSGAAVESGLFQTSFKFMRTYISIVANRFYHVMIKSSVAPNLATERE